MIKRQSIKIAICSLYICTPFIAYSAIKVTDTTQALQVIHDRMYQDYLFVNRTIYTNPFERGDMPSDNGQPTDNQDTGQHSDNTQYHKVENQNRPKASTQNHPKSSAQNRPKASTQNRPKSSAQNRPKSRQGGGKRKK